MHNHKKISRPAESILQQIASGLEAPDSAPPDCQAAVMALFVIRERLELLVIRKLVREGYPWSGQIAFPGGRRDPQDDSLLDTAYREIHEELTITAESVILLGFLRSYPTHILGLHVGCFVGLWDGTGPITPAADEIAWYGTVDFMDLSKYHNGPKAKLSSHREDMGGPTFPIAGHEAWGLTARMIVGLIELSPRRKSSPCPGS